MSQDSPAEDTLTLEELSEVLAEATGRTTDEIERGGARMNLASPEEATVIEDGE